VLVLFLYLFLKLQRSTKKMVVWGQIDLKKPLEQD
jgi:hypothetical protein